MLRFASNNPATHGAELGFVWTVPQDKRYLVLLNKVQLDDPVEIAYGKGEDWRNL